MNRIKQIVDEIRSKNTKPIYFLMGEEAYYIDKISDFIENNILSEEEKGFNQMILYGRDVTVDDIVGNAKRFPMMSEKQVVIVKEAQDLSRSIEKLADYAENPQPSTVLVICYKYKTIDKRKKLAKTIAQTGCLFESKKLYENQVSDWINSLLREKGYHQLGGFDEQYFAHQEEIDLCWRVQNEGHGIQYVGTSKVYHVGGATLQESNPQKTYLNFRNSLFTIAKNVPKRYVFLVIFFRLILDGVAGIKFMLELRPVHTWSIIKAHLSFYRNLRKMLAKRRALSFKQTNYFYCFSIVWEHFILRKKLFSNIK